MRISGLVKTASGLFLSFSVAAGTAAASFPQETYVREIHFTGNTLFSDRELQGALQISRPGDRFYPEGLRYDLTQNVLPKYQELGYLMARADFHLPETGSGPEVELTVSIQEGPQYRFGSWTVTGNQHLKTEQLEEILAISQGQPVNQQKFLESLREMEQTYVARGFLDVKIDPEYAFDSEEGLLNLHLAIEEGPAYRVHRIAFEGVNEHYEELLRWALLVEEMKAFSPALLNSSLMRLNQLGLLGQVITGPGFVLVSFSEFAAVDYQVKKMPEQGEVDLLVEVDLRSRRQLEHPLYVLQAKPPADENGDGGADGDAPAGDAPAKEGAAAGNASPAGDTPTGDPPAGGSPAGGSPAGGSPAGGSPAGESPLEDAPANEASPAGQEPARVWPMRRVQPRRDGS